MYNFSAAQTENETKPVSSSIRAHRIRLLVRHQRSDAPELHRQQARRAEQLDSDGEQFRFNSLMPNWYNCTYVSFLFLRSNCCKKLILFLLKLRLSICSSSADVRTPLVPSATWCWASRTETPSSTWQRTCRSSSSSSRSSVVAQRR